MDTSEKNFEAAIEQTLLGITRTDVVSEPLATYETPSQYIKRRPEDYDKTLCLDAGMLFNFIYATQPKIWEKLKQQHGEAFVKERFLKRLVKEIENRGTLDVLRKGVTDLGCKFDLAYFKPETKLNEEHKRLYNANILSVARQLKYSLKNENSIDLTIFLNGLPIITAELKNPLKGQDVQNAIKQYKYDRDPKEPLFAFGRCLAHFAVDTDLVFMTTHLNGGKTNFLPFNKGNNKGAGNPENPSGFKTAYLWEDVWQRDNLLEIINHFLQIVEEEDDKGKKTGKRKLIFPRYHQWEAVRKLVAHAKANETGQHYLIQHSAGSGKSNTIAWLSHQLAGLHNVEDKRVFDSVIVITDRRVLDRQLQQTVRSFEQVRGVVTTISEHKSENLAKALETGSDIIVTTLQTFPFTVDLIRKMSGNRFAVIIDEAHSSQSGESVKAVKEVLSTDNMEEAQKEDSIGVPDEEDAINTAIETEMKKRGRLKNVSFFAFTATPKSKTMELFGTQQPDGTFIPFSLYSMRQAIEERFILDVLKNYTTFKIYFNLLKKIEDDPQYDRKKGVYLLKSYADLHEHGIRTKTEIIVEHFHKQVRERIKGLAKAMLVTRSRLHAVRYKQAFDKYLNEQHYPYKALVAFSGTVRDPKTGLEFTESGMNGFPESQTAENFKQHAYRFLIVANKFQTGFDQPLLHTMYVDKKLGGVNAVQTLSRLNRTHPHKEDTFVLDFANNIDEIRESFQPYYEATYLGEATDPNKLYDLKRMLEEYHIFSKADVEAFAAVYFSEKGKQEKLHVLLDPMVSEYLIREKEQREDFRKHLDDYVRLYAFISQILTFTDTNLEKLYQFSRHIRRKLPVTRDVLPVEITDNINMDSYRIQQTSTGAIKLISEDGELHPISDLGTGRPTEEELAPLSEIVAYINEHYGTEFTDEDKVRYFAEDMQLRLIDKEGLAKALDKNINPSEENRRLAFDNFFKDALEDMIDANFEIYKKINDDPNLSALFRAMMFNKVSRTVAIQK